MKVRIPAMDEPRIFTILSCKRRDGAVRRWHSARKPEGDVLGVVGDESGRNSISEQEAKS